MASLSGSLWSVPKMATLRALWAEKLIFSLKTLQCLIDLTHINIWGFNIQYDMKICLVKEASRHLLPFLLFKNGVHSNLLHQLFDHTLGWLFRKFWQKPVCRIGTETFGEMHPFHGHQRYWAIYQGPAYTRASRQGRGLFPIHTQEEGKRRRRTWASHFHTAVCASNKLSTKMA